MQMFSRKIAFSVFLLFALCPSPTAAYDCFYMSRPSGALYCTSYVSIYKNLTSVDLSFFNFQNLKKIYLGFNNLVLPPRLSRATKETLEWLNLLDNKIATIPGDYFSFFPSLTKLSLDYNLLTEMPSFSSDIQAQLVHFYISNNKISSIPPGYLNSFSELRTLSISYNRILSLPSGTSVGHLRKLRWLDIDQMPCDLPTILLWRQIAKLPRLRVSPRSVRIRTEVGLSYTVYPCYGKFKDTTLMVLRSTDNEKVCSNTSRPSDAPFCTTFDSSYQNLESVDLSNFQFINLKKIILRSNNLDLPPRLSTSAMDRLEELNLHNNKIATIPGDYFSVLSSLTGLNLARNRLTEMPWFSRRIQAQIVYLYISNNNISSIHPGQLNSFSELTSLSINGNRILRFPSGTSVGHLRKLRRLYIDRMPCDLVTLQVWQQFAKIPRLRNPGSFVRIRIGVDNFVSDYPCSGEFNNMTLEQLRSTDIGLFDRG